MRCYIRVSDGQVVGNPVVAENMIQAFPGIDLDNLPEGWAPFDRIQQPEDLLTSCTQVAVCTYTLSSDDVTWQDTWTAREMTYEERVEAYAEKLSLGIVFPNMQLNPATLVWEPNTPMPTDGNTYRWKKRTGEWVIDTP